MTPPSLPSRPRWDVQKAIAWEPYPLVAVSFRSPLRVPFHGRLFAQWMHHAYPRECQFPHLSGTTKPLGPEEWAALTGEDMVASEETMRWHVDEVARSARPNSADSQFTDELPWVSEEDSRADIGVWRCGL